MFKKSGLSQKEYLRSFGIEGHTSFGWLRYKNPPEKGIYWYFFSLYVRLRDVIKHGTCISCGRTITLDTCDAGHFMPAADCGRDLLFDERNVNAECSYCNAWDATHLLGYAEGLDERYGEGTATELRALRNQYKASSEVRKDWKADEYFDKISVIKTKYEALL